MASRILVDSGPIVALLDRQDKHHEWAKGEIANLRDPLLTCDAVISEVFFLLSRIRGGNSVFIALHCCVMGWCWQARIFLTLTTRLKFFGIWNDMPIYRCLLPTHAW